MIASGGRYVFQTIRSPAPHLLNLESIDEARLLFAHKVLRLFVIDAQLEDLQNWIACHRNENQRGTECQHGQQTDSVGTKKKMGKGTRGREEIEGRLILTFVLLLHQRQLNLLEPMEVIHTGAVVRHTGYIAQRQKRLSTKIIGREHIVIHDCEANHGAIDQALLQCDRKLKALIENGIQSALQERERDEEMISLEVL